MKKDFKIRQKRTIDKEENKELAVSNKVMEVIMEENKKTISEEINKVIKENTKLKDFNISGIEVEISQKGILEAIKDIKIEDLVKDDLERINDEKWSGNIYSYSF